MNDYEVPTKIIVRKKVIIGDYSYEKSGRTDGNMFFTIIRGNDWKKLST